MTVFCSLTLLQRAVYSPLSVTATNDVNTARTSIASSSLLRATASPQSAQPFCRLILFLKESPTIAWERNLKWLRLSVTKRHKKQLKITQSIDYIIIHTAKYLKGKFGKFGSFTDHFDLGESCD